MRCQAMCATQYGYWSFSGKVIVAFRAFAVSYSSLLLSAAFHMP